MADISKIDQALQAQQPLSRAAANIIIDKTKTALMAAETFANDSQPGTLDAFTDKTPWEAASHDRGAAISQLGAAAGTIAAGGDTVSDEDFQTLQTAVDACWTAINETEEVMGQSSDVIDSIPDDVLEAVKNAPSTVGTAVGTIVGTAASAAGNAAGNAASATLLSFFKGLGLMGYVLVGAVGLVIYFKYIKGK